MTEQLANAVLETYGMQKSLQHFGVKGMRWGVRKSEASATPIHAEYTKGRLSRDKTMFGKKGVAKINANLYAGLPYKQARNRQLLRRQVTTSIKTGAIVGAYILASFGPEIAASTKDSRDRLSKNIAERAETKRGERMAADHFGLGENNDIAAKQNRKGVYNVTSM